VGAARPLHKNHFSEQPLNDHLDLPFARSYWVIPGKLLAGEYPGAVQPDAAKQRLSSLFGCGIRHVVNLMEIDEVNHEGQAFAPYADWLQAAATQSGQQVSCVRYPIRDGSIPGRLLMQQILDDIDGAISAGRPVYVHCWGGKGRTGTVVGCYLIRHNLVSGNTALDEITRLRRDIHPYQESPETDQQRDLVRSWKVGE
jgi:hypothetical protein